MSRAAAEEAARAMRRQSDIGAPDAAPAVDAEVTPLDVLQNVGGLEDFHMRELSLTRVHSALHARTHLRQTAWQRACLSDSRSGLIHA